MLLLLIFISAENYRQALVLIGVYAGYLVVPMLCQGICDFLNISFAFPFLFSSIVAYYLISGYIAKSWVKPVLAFLLVLLFICTFRIGAIGLVVLSMSIVYGYRSCKKLAEKKKYLVITLLVAMVLLINYHILSQFAWIDCGAACRSHLNNIATALEKYNTDWKSYPDLLKQLHPAYISEVPQCSPYLRNIFFGTIYRETGDYKPVPYSYEVNAERTRYTITCRSENHNFLYAPGFPRYSSDNGLERRHVSENSSGSH